MMFKFDTYDDTLDEVLGHSLDYLDIPPEIRRRAVARFNDVATWLTRFWLSANGGDIYCQGSFRLGTVVRPITRDGQYDVDLVCCLNLLPSSITQEELKARVGAALRAYVASTPIGSLKLKEGGRCWTLVYPGEPFHMDVLPAIPDPPGTGVSLTDRDLRKWQSSNPIAYAEWFRGVMQPEVLILKEAARAMNVEPLPDDEIKTMLQRAVQALKRHRDIFLADNCEIAPASIIATTLAAKAYADGAYTSGASLSSVLMDIVTSMPEHITFKNGIYIIENPVCPTENFADRWNKHPERADAFFSWMTEVQDDFAAHRDAGGLPTLLESVAKSFGDDAKIAAARKVGTDVTDRRRAGLLTVGGTGLIGASSRRPVADHTFHGDAPTSRPA